MRPEYRETRRLLRERKKATGTCYDCSLPAFKQGRCAAHYEYSRQYSETHKSRHAETNRQRRNRLRAAGQCIDCPNPAPTRSRCDECAARCCLVMRWSRSSKASYPISALLSAEIVDLQSMFAECEKTYWDTLETLSISIS